MKSNCWTQSSLARESAHEFAFLKMYCSNFLSNKYTRLLLTYFISSSGFQKHSPSINGSLHYCLYHDRFEKKKIKNCQLRGNKKGWPIKAEWVAKRKCYIRICRPLHFLYVWFPKFCSRDAFAWVGSVYSQLRWLH